MRWSDVEMLVGELFLGPKKSSNIRHVGTVFLIKCDNIEMTF